MKNGNPRTDQRDLPSTIEVTVDQMGGIDSTKLTFSPGVTILTGRNATNRTSLLRSIAGGLGGTAGALKRDAQQGCVSLNIGKREYKRRYVREDGQIRTDGDPYTDQAEIIDLFVCLLEDNPIRQAVRADENLAELLLAPVDTDELEQKIARLQSKRDQIDEQLNEIDRERKRLPTLEERRTELQTKLADVQSQLEETRSEIDSVENSSTNDEQAKSLLTTLEETQTELEQTESEIETQRSIQEELAEELTDVRRSLSEMDVREDEISEVKQEVDQLQGRESELSTTINELSTILSQNKRVLEGDDSVITELSTGNETASELNPMDQQIECWTCGSDVQRRAIATQLEDIEDLLEAKRAERKKLRETLSDRRDQYESLRSKVDRRSELKDRKDELERELTQRSEVIDDLQSTATDLRDEIAELQSDLDSLDSVTDDGVSVFERLSELEYERGKLERELSETENEINEIEYQLSKSDDLETRRSNLADQIESLRSRVDDLERDVVESFNTHMEAVLERLAYENVDRIWIERLVNGNETRFELHIVRTDSDGTVYEDSISHLSESEREVVGLIIALAGYLTYDIQEDVPLLLLDSLEAIDANRIGDLITYIRTYTDYLILALLNEDAEELAESYDRIDAETSLA